MVVQTRVRLQWGHKLLYLRVITVRTFCRVFLSDKYEPADTSGVIEEHSSWGGRDFSSLRLAVVFRVKMNNGGLFRSWKYGY